MIKTFNDLLEAIRAKRIKEIEPFLNIKHGPTIGDMYEGLTKEIVSKALFESTDVRVASGFITNSDGDMTKQIDCMIVVGDGKQIPNTTDYIYDIKNVIMVIEVKKNLHSKELSDGYNNLRSVYKISKPDHDLRANMINDAFEAMTGKKAPKHEDVGKLPIREQMLWHALTVEALLPLRVIFGFDGFKSELSLRQKFIDYLTEKTVETASDLKEAEERLNSDDYQGEKPEEKKGYGAPSLPNLIIAGNNSIVKTNGMPYGLIFDQVDEYCWMASYRRSPLLVFLELLWTRLTYYYDLPTDVFGADVQCEGIAPLLTATGTKNMWIYNPIILNEEQIAVLDNDRPWEPVTLNQEEFILMNLLCEEKIVRVSELDRYANKDEILKHLVNSRLVHVDWNSDQSDGTLGLLTKECKCVIDPEMGFIAGDDSDGRLTYWLMERMKKWRSGG